MAAGLALVTAGGVATQLLGWELRHDLYLRGEALAQVLAHQAGLVELGLPLVAGVFAATLLGQAALAGALQRGLGAAGGAALALTTAPLVVPLGLAFLSMLLPVGLLAWVALGSGRARWGALVLGVLSGEALAPGVGVGLAALGGVAAGGSASTRTPLAAWAMGVGLAAASLVSRLAPAQPAWGSAAQALVVVGALMAISRSPWPRGVARLAGAGLWGGGMVAFVAWGGWSLLQPAPAAPMRVDLGPVATLASLDGPALHLPDTPVPAMSSAPTHPAVRLISRLAGAEVVLPEGALDASPQPLLADPLLPLSWNLAAGSSEPEWALPPGDPGDAAAALGVRWVVVHRGWLSPSALAALDPLLRRHLGLPQRDLAHDLDLYRLPDVAPEAPTPAPRVPADGPLPDGWRTQADAIAGWSMASR